MGYAEGDRVHQLIRDFAVLIGAVAEPSNHLGVAFAVAHGRGVDPAELRAFQVHLPDPAGLFAGDRGYAGPAGPVLGPMPQVRRDQTLPDPDAG